MILRPRLRTALLSALAFATCAGVTVYINKLSELDPFAGLRGPPADLNAIDIQFRNVEMKHWQGAKVLTSGHIGRVDVHRDRQLYELYDVSDGVYHSADATFRYSGGHAMWYTAAQRLEADRGAHISGKNFEFAAPQFVYNAPTHLVEIRGPTTGTLDGGHAKVVDLKYNISDETFETGEIDWHGRVALNFQEPEKSGPPSQGGKSDDDSVHEWDVHGDHTSHPKKGAPVKFTNVRATDKVSIMTAPSGTWDRDKDILVCEGPVKYWGERANMVCDHLVLYHKEKRAVATGNVVMYLKPEDKQVLDEKMEVPPFRPIVPEKVSKERPPAPLLTDKHSKEANDELRSTDNIKKYPTTIRADKIDYWYKKGERHAICTGSPQAQQEFPEGRWRMVWTHEALYDGEKERLKLVSSAGQKDTRMKNSIGDDATAKDMDISTKDGEDAYEADDETFHGTSFDQEANEAADKAKADKDKAGTKNSPPPPKKNPPGLSGPIGGPRME